MGTAGLNKIAGWDVDDAITIGLVNNMPDAALRATERQFSELLSTPLIPQHVQLKLFFLPEIPRSDIARLHLEQHYRPISELQAIHLDGLIVTGAEPRTRLLEHEAYWRSLTKLVEWAARHTVSTVWSCLAAHAAVLYLSGIERRALRDKLVGVFDCDKVEDHPILAGVPSRWRVPHSRYNELPGELLQSDGYRVLSTSAQAGVDLFVKEFGSLFIFLHGHPEYAPDTLFREYRRDLLRFLGGERETYPAMPSGYFDANAVSVFEAFRARAVRCRNIDLIAQLPTNFAHEPSGCAWRDPAVRIFGNWLSYIAQSKTRLGLPPPYAPAIVEACQELIP